MDGWDYNFGWALQQMREGKRMQRRGWNGKNMYTYHVKGLEPDGRDYLALFDAYGMNGPWTPSATDLLAFDWQVVPS